MSATAGAAAWPVADLAEALQLLGSHAGYRPRAELPEPPPSGFAAQHPPERWIECTARWLELEAEPVEATYAELETLVRRSPPALLQLPGEPARFLAIVRASGQRLTVLTPERTLRSIPLNEALDELVVDEETTAAADVERVLAEAGIPERQRRRAGDRMLHERLASSRLTGCWLIRPGTASPALAQVDGKPLLTRAAALLGALGLQHALFIGSWWLIGWMALTDRLEVGWLTLWVLLFAAVVLLRVYAYGRAGHLSIDVSAGLKQQLLRGAFKLHPDEVRRQGAGQLLGRTLEVEAIESFTFVGAFLTLTALIELVFAGAILGIGAAGAWHVLLLALWTGLLFGVAAAYYRRRHDWTELRLGLTNDLVEKMVGHRTRALQEPRQRWHDREDQRLEGYHGLSRQRDHWEVALDTWVPRGWFLVGLAALAPAFLAGGHGLGRLAAGIGGVLLGYRAFRSLASGIEQMTGAIVAWKRLQPLLEARHRAEPAGLPTITVAREPGKAFPSVRALLDARGLGFRYPGRAENVLDGANLEVRTGDRILLEGPSGGGKSTLARLLAALDRPQPGVLLLEGMDPATLGIHEWRRRVVFVPQFHDNHVLLGSFAYNLLMGRRWPPEAAELREAEAVCRALGLGPLLDRMPGGLFQMVGETGWQLSHGERSRLFLARAILQKPDVMIIDESLAALDPGTLRTVQDTLLASESAIVLIAHP